MQLTEDEILKKYAKPFGHSNRNSLLPYEFEWTCISCGFNLIERKRELTKLQPKEIKFLNRIKYAEQKTFAFA